MKLRLVAGLVGLLSLASGELYTLKHEAGRCAIRGTCVDGGLFSQPLPCPDNGLAENPEDDVRKQLVDLCGPKWRTGPVCCDGSQVCIVILNISSLLIGIDRCPLLEPSKSTTIHFCLPGLQRELLQPILHIYLLSRPVSVYKCHGGSREKRQVSCGRA
jgi:hypothetical protein